MHVSISIIHDWCKLNPSDAPTETEGVSNLVLFLAGDKAHYATGSQFVIDAGLLRV